MNEDRTRVRTSSAITLREVSYREAARQALQVQNACNLSGVVISFAECVLAVKAEAAKRREGGEWVRCHPAVYLFEDKVADLIGRSHFEDMERYHEATVECERIAAKPRADE